jgi:hypothetical protein
LMMSVVVSSRPVALNARRPRLFVGVVAGVGFSLSAMTPLYRTSPRPAAKTAPANLLFQQP